MVVVRLRGGVGNREGRRGVPSRLVTRRAPGVPSPSPDPAACPQQSPCVCPDVSESSCSGRPAAGSAAPRKQPGGRAADTEGLAPHPAHEAHGSPEQPAALPSKPLLSAPMRNGERLASLVLDAQRPLGDLERSRLRKVQTFSRLLPDGPEASALCLTLGPATDQLPTPALFPPDPRKAFLGGKNGLSSHRTKPEAKLWPEQEPEIRPGGPGGASRGGDGASGAPGWSPTEESPPPRPKDPGDAGREPGTWRPEEGTLNGAGEPASTATEQVGDSRCCPRSRQGPRTRAPGHCWSLATRKGVSAFTPVLMYEL